LATTRWTNFNYNFPNFPINQSNKLKEKKGNFFSMLASNFSLPLYKYLQIFIKE